MNLRAAPKSVEDVFISAGCNWLVSFENISQLSGTMQDALCTLATGGGFAARTLYTNADETTISVKRPVIINAIPHVITAQDLTDRAVCIDLEPIAFREESEVLTEWNAKKGRVLGALFDLFAATLARLPDAKPDPTIRMADFVRLGEAMALALGHQHGEFTQLYRENRQSSVLTSLDSSPAALAICDMVEGHGDHRGDEIFHGTVKQLLDRLTRDFKHAGDGWPKSPKGLAEVIRRQQPAFSALGLVVELGTRKERIGDAQGFAVRVARKSGNVGNMGSTLQEFSAPRKVFSGNAERF